MGSQVKNTSSTLLLKKQNYLQTGTKVSKQKQKGEQEVLPRERSRAWWLLTESVRREGRARDLWLRQMKWTGHIAYGNRHKGLFKKKRLWPTCFRCRDPLWETSDKGCIVYDICMTGIVLSTFYTLPHLTLTILNIGIVLPSLRMRTWITRCHPACC